MSDLLAIVSGAAVGLILALIGGGGSILATPALLYVVGIADAHVAIGTGAVAVSVNAFINLVPHARRRNVKWPCAAVFALAGVIGATAGATLGKLTDARILLPLFALLMIVVGVAMLRGRNAEGDPDVSLNPAIAVRLVAAGLGTGVLAGFFGIGGGFLVVPGLIAASGMTIIHAVGSSLLAVGAFGAATAASYAMNDLVDWRIAALFIVGGVIGGLIGATLSGRLAQRKGALQSVFAFVIFAVALYMLWRSFT